MSELEQKEFGKIDEEKMSEQEELSLAHGGSIDLLKTIKMLEAKVNALEDAGEKTKGEKDEEDEEPKFPSDSYSMMALNGPKRWSSWGSVCCFFFGIGVWFLQMCFLGLILFSQASEKRGTIEEGDNPDEGIFALIIPPNVQGVVVATQIISLIVYVLFPESSMGDCVTAFHLFPPFSKNNESGPLWNLRFASIMRGTQAIAAILVSWILVMTSGTPIDIILNFAAINFVSDLDDAAFQLAEAGIFGDALQEETQRVAETNLPKCVQKKEERFWYWIVMSLSSVILFSLAIYAFLAQASDDRWISETIRVEFTGKSFAKYSGCFRVEPEARVNFKRYTYQSHLTEVNTTLGYCRADRQWILFDGHDLTFDPCEANAEEIGVEVARSADTDSFDVSAVFDERWSSSSGAPLDLYFFESTEEDELDCNLVLGDGLCDEVFNDPGYDFDQGDCCSATCVGPNCLKGGMTSVFGIEGMESFGYPNCRDDDMVPITIRLNAVTSSRDTEEWPGDFCYDDYYVDEETWRKATPTPTYFDLDCDGKPVMTVNIDNRMEGQTETVWVKDGAECTLLVRNSTGVDDEKSRCTADPIWYVNSTFFHGDKGDESIEVISHHSAANETLNFTRFPDCYINELGKRLKLAIAASTIYTGTGPSNKAIDWLLEDGTNVASCGEDGFGTRFNLVYLFFATTPENKFIQREKHCTWKSIKCGVTGEIETIDLHSSGLDATFPLPNNVDDFPDLKSLAIYDNTITSIETDIGLFKTLRELNFEDNLVSSIPTEICSITGLNELFFAENNISIIPTEIGFLTNLTRLHVSKNPLDNMPTEIGQLKNLYQLEAYESNLDSIPTEIGMMESLEELYLNDNELTLLPTEIGQLTNLQRFHLGSNQLLSIPTEIGLLTNLEELKLESNLLVSLPTEISLLTKLQEIVLGSNDTVTCDDLPEGAQAVCRHD